MSMIKLKSGSIYRKKSVVLRNEDADYRCLPIEVIRIRGLGFRPDTYTLYVNFSLQNTAPTDGYSSVGWVEHSDTHHLHALAT